MTCKLLSYVILLSLSSCTSDGKKQDHQEAQKLYSEGMELLDQRLLIQNIDAGKAKEINKAIIDKFAESYFKDTLFVEPVRFASECTMYGQDFKQCIYWTNKLLQIDNEKDNVSFCNERIKYCEAQMK